MFVIQKVNLNYVQDANPIYQKTEVAIELLAQNAVFSFAGCVKVKLIRNIKLLLFIRKKVE